MLVDNVYELVLINVKQIKLNSNSDKTIIILFEEKKTPKNKQQQIRRKKLFLLYVILSMDYDSRVYSEFHGFQPIRHYIVKTFIQTWCENTFIRK